MASLFGLRDLTIGQLSTEVNLSKSGLYAHFDSKEQLQVEVLQKTAAIFLEYVVQPALRQPRGLPRLVGLFEGWLNWSNQGVLPGGCVFVAATSEWDDRDGRVRDALVTIQKGWLAVIARAVELSKEQGHLRPDLDAEQVAFDVHGIMLSFHHQSRLLREDDARARAEESFASLLNRSQLVSESLRYQELLRNMRFTP